MTSHSTTRGYEEEPWSDEKAFLAASFRFYVDFPANARRILLSFYGRNNFQFKLACMLGIRVLSISLFG